MATSSSVYEFPCGYCSQVILLSPEHSGQAIGCPACYANLVAPQFLEESSNPNPTDPKEAPAIEPTGQGLVNAAYVVAQPEPDYVAPSFLGEVDKSQFQTSESIEQLRKQAKRSASQSKQGERTTRPAEISAGRLSRVFAGMIDVFAGVASLFMGIAPVAALVSTGRVNMRVIDRFTRFLEVDLMTAMETKDYLKLQHKMQVFSDELWLVIACSVSFLVLFGMWQLFLMSTKGQTIGKKLMKIKVVDSEGFTAGFTRGVLLRSLPVWAIAAAGYLIFGGLIADGFKILFCANFIAIAMNPPRCMHDYIAGTYVVSC